MGDPSANRQNRDRGGDAPAENRWGWLQPWRSGESQGRSQSVSDRRTGNERRSALTQEEKRLEEKRRRARRRAHVRKRMPFGGVAPSGRICCEPHGCVHADLMDVSEGGSCVLLASPIPLKNGDRLTLTLHENFGFSSLEVELEVRWLVDTPIGLRVGACFVDPAFRPSQTFLKTYLDADFGGHRSSDD